MEFCQFSVLCVEAVFAEVRTPRLRSFVVAEVLEQLTWNFDIRTIHRVYPNWEHTLFAGIPIVSYLFLCWLSVYTAILSQKKYSPWVVVFNHSV
jgi:hypothetical protein